MSQPDAVAFLQRQALLHPAGPGPAEREGEETRGVLHRRLAVLSPVCGAVWASFLLVSLTGAEPAFAREQIGAVAQGLLGLATAVSAASALVLRARPGLALPWLRGLELLIFGTYA